MSARGNTSAREKFHNTRTPSDVRGKIRYLGEFIAQKVKVNLVHGFVMTTFVCALFPLAHVLEPCGDKQFMEDLVAGKTLTGSSKEVAVPLYQIRDMSLGRS